MVHTARSSMYSNISSLTHCVAIVVQVCDAYVPCAQSQEQSVMQAVIVELIECVLYAST